MSNQKKLRGRRRGNTCEETLIEDGNKGDSRSMSGDFIFRHHEVSL